MGLTIKSHVFVSCPYLNFVEACLSPILERESEEEHRCSWSLEWGAECRVSFSTATVPCP